MELFLTEEQIIFTLGLPYVRIFPDMPGILALKFESGNNFEKCPYVRNFSAQSFVRTYSVAAGFGSALHALSDDRKSPWLRSNFALCCFDQSFADLNCYLSFKFAFLRTFLLFHAFAIFL